MAEVSVTEPDPAPEELNETNELCCGPPATGAGTVPLSVSTTVGAGAFVDELESLLLQAVAAKTSDKPNAHNPNVFMQSSVSTDHAGDWYRRPSLSLAEAVSPVGKNCARAGKRMTLLLLNIVSYR
jgi:hypothetical protein